MKKKTTNFNKKQNLIKEFDSYHDLLDSIVNDIVSNKDALRAWKTMNKQLKKNGTCSAYLLEKMRLFVINHINALSDSSLKKIWEQTEAGFLEDDIESLDPEWIRFQSEDEILYELLSLCSED